MKRFWQIGIVVSLLFALVANFVVGAQLLWLPSIDEISDTYATVLTPASYAFSIWSLIYILLIGFAIYQARDLLRPQKKNILPIIAGPWFIVASIMNGLWTFVFVADFIGLSVLVLLTLTVSLYILLFKLDMAMYDAPLRTIAFVWWPLLIYTGWVTVATIVNSASWFQSLGIGVSPEVAIAVLIVLGALLMALILLRNVRELALVSAWGIIAIGVQQLPSNELVATSAFTVGAIVVLTAGVHGILHRATAPHRKVKHKISDKFHR